jgi:nucleotide-binding universal stress UspA family protein
VIGLFADSRVSRAGDVRGVMPVQFVSGPILVAADGSPSAAEAVEQAVELAASSRRPLRVVSVWTLPVGIAAFESLTELTQLEEELRSLAEDVVRRAVEKAKEAGVAVSTHVRCGNAADEIRAEAERCGAALVVVGAHGASRPDGDAVGSVALELLSRVQRPVLLVRARRPRESTGAGTTPGSRSARATASNAGVPASE